LEQRSVALSEEDHERLLEIQQRLFRSAGIEDMPPAILEMVKQEFMAGGSDVERAADRVFDRLQNDPTLQEVREQWVRVLIGQEVTQALLQEGYRPDPDHPGEWLPPD
jgi:hypothetical protein